MRIYFKCWLTPEARWEDKERDARIEDAHLGQGLLLAGKLLWSL